MWTADRDLYLTADGQVVEAGDERAAYLLARKGQRLTAEVARKYGLGSDDVESKAKSGPPENKARMEPHESKGEK